MKRGGDRGSVDGGLVKKGTPRSWGPVGPWKNGRKSAKEVCEISGKKSFPYRRGAGRQGAIVGKNGGGSTTGKGGPYRMTGGGRRAEKAREGGSTIPRSDPSKEKTLGRQIMQEVTTQVGPPRKFALKNIINVSKNTPRGGGKGPRGEGPWEGVQGGEKGPGNPSERSFRGKKVRPEPRAKKHELLLQKKGGNHETTQNGQPPQEEFSRHGRGGLTG